MYYKFRNKLIEQDLDMGGMTPIGIVDGIIVFYRKDITGDNYNYIRMYEIATDTWTIVGRRINDFDNLHFSFQTPDRKIYMVTSNGVFYYDFRTASEVDGSSKIPFATNVAKVVSTSNKLFIIFENDWYVLMDATI